MKYLCFFLFFSKMHWIFHDFGIILYEFTLNSKQPRGVMVAQLVLVQLV